jgi:hypothetical protein
MTAVVQNMLASKRKKHEENGGKSDLPKQAKTADWVLHQAVS